MHESSSDSDFYDLDGNFGPTTRKAWSDWCSSKGKSSQSEEEGGNKVIFIYIFLFKRFNMEYYLL